MPTTPCPHCPMRDDPGTPCVALTSDYNYCEKVDPDGPRYRPRMVEGVRRLSRERAGPGVEEAPPPRTPSVFWQAASFGKALAVHVAGGMKTVSPELKAARLAICATCEKFDSEHMRCRACGCRLRKKAAWKQEHCPLKKWPGDGA